MSLKPVKKSDQNKSWMQPRRDRRKMIQPEYHLIFIVANTGQNSRKSSYLSERENIGKTVMICTGSYIHT